MNKYGELRLKQAMTAIGAYEAQLSRATLEVLEETPRATIYVLQMIAFGGQIACVDSLPNLSKIRPFSKALSLHEIALGVAHLFGDREAQAQFAEIGSKIGELINKGYVKPVISNVIPLECVPEGLSEIAERHVRGKIVAKIV